MPSERLTAERLAELEKEIDDNDPYFLTTLKAKELRDLIATARRAAKYEAALVKIVAAGNDPDLYDECGDMARAALDES